MSKLKLVEAIRIEKKEIEGPEIKSLSGARNIIIAAAIKRIYQDHNAFRITGNIAGNSNSKDEKNSIDNESSKAKRILESLAR